MPSFSLHRVSTLGPAGLQEELQEVLQQLAVSCRVDCNSRSFPLEKVRSPHASPAQGAEYSHPGRVQWRFVNDLRTGFCPPPIILDVRRTVEVEVGLVAANQQGFGGNSGQD